MREQPFELLQPAVAVRVDDRLELPASLAQRSQPIGRHCQRRIRVGQHLRHLPRALAGRLLHQRLLRRYVQHRSRLWFRRRLPLGRPCGRRRAVRPHNRSGPGPARSLAITPFEGGLQLRRRVQRQRTVPESLAHAVDPRAQLHGVDPPPRGGVAVAEPAQASLPSPLRINRASGSVLLRWVRLLSRSPRKSTVGLPGSSGSSRSASSLRKLLMLAAVSISVPSTLKCSSDSSPCRSASSTTSSNSAWPILCSSTHLRFLVNTVGSKLRSTRFCLGTSGTADCTRARSSSDRVRSAGNQGSRVQVPIAR